MAFLGAFAVLSLSCAIIGGGTVADQLGVLFVGMVLAAYDIREITKTPLPDDID